MRIVFLTLLSVYTLCLLYVEWSGGQAGVRPYVTDITGEVRFYAIHTSLSVALLAACSGLNLLILGLVRRARGDWRAMAFHLFQVALFAYLAFDDRFMVHEELGMRLGIDDALILGAIGLLELLVLATLGRLQSSTPAARRTLLLAGIGFGAMTLIDGTFPSQMRFRLSLEDLCKLWAGAMLLLFHLELYTQWLDRAAGKRELPPVQSPRRLGALLSIVAGNVLGLERRVRPRFGLGGAATQLLMGLALLIAILASAHAISEILVYTGHMPLRLQLYLDMDHEGNLPSWVSGLLLFCCALCCSAIASAQSSLPFDRRNSSTRWLLAAIGFALLSVDEVIQLHEAFEGNYFGLGLSSHWYIYLAPVAIPVAVVVVALIWRALVKEPAARRVFTFGAGLALVSAIALESLRVLFEEGALLEGVGEAQLLQVLLEETGELLGVALMLVGLVEVLLQRVERALASSDR